MTATTHFQSQPGRVNSGFTATPSLIQLSAFRIEAICPMGLGLSEGRGWRGQSEGVRMGGGASSEAETSDQAAHLGRLERSLVAACSGMDIRCTQNTSVEGRWWSVLGRRVAVWWSVCWTTDHSLLSCGFDLLAPGWVESVCLLFQANPMSERCHLTMRGLSASFHG